MAENSLALIKPQEDTVLLAIYQEAIALRNFAEARVIATNDDLSPANDDLAVIARVKKGMEAKRKDYLKPFQDHIKDVNDAYKTFMEPIEQADKITRDKILTFRAEQERKRREAEAIEAEKTELARREAELTGGEITVDLTPVVKPEAVPDRIRGELGSSGKITIWKFEVIDFSLLPDRFKMENATLIGKVVRAGEREIPGVRIWGEDSLRVNTK